MKKQLQFFLFLLFTSTVSNAQNTGRISGAQEVCPIKFVNSYTYTATFPADVTDETLITWVLENGIFDGYGQGNVITKKAKEAKTVRVIWQDKPQQGKITYFYAGGTVRVSLPINILSVKGVEIPYLTVSGVIKQNDTLYIPEGKSGSFVCSVPGLYFPVYPYYKEITDFTWVTPSSWGGGTIKGGNQLTINYPASGGDGGTITVKATSCTSSGEVYTLYISRTGTNFSVKNVSSENSGYDKTVSKSGINSVSMMKQNVPNPFYAETIVSCVIPDNVENAKLQIFNTLGELVKCLRIIERGNCSITIEGTHFKPGIYICTLVLDGQPVATKSMLRAN